MAPHQHGRSDAKNRDKKPKNNIQRRRPTQAAHAIKYQMRVECTECLNGHTMPTIHISFRTIEMNTNRIVSAEVQRRPNLNGNPYIS